MSRPNVTDTVVDGLKFARACVLDQRAASHHRGDHTWDKRYATALSVIDFVVTAHERAIKAKIKRASKLKKEVQ